MIQKILSELRRQMNGAVSQTMREMGLNEPLNFGVSLPTIKEIALRYSPNHALAVELSGRKSREARIAALYIADPELLTIEQMDSWSESWETEEIARLSAMLLFHKSPYAEQIAFRWLDDALGFKRESPAIQDDTSALPSQVSVLSNEPSDQTSLVSLIKSEVSTLSSQTSAMPYNDFRLLREVSALYITGKIASKAKNALVEKAFSFAERGNTNAVVFCLREIYFVREEFRAQISDLARFLPDLEWQIEQ